MLVVSTKFYIGGKHPVFVGPLDISMKSQVQDVIAYVLTLYRKNKELKTMVPLEHSDQPDCFEFRHVDDDSEDSDVSNQVLYKPNWDLPPLAKN